MIFCTINCLPPKLHYNKFEIKHKIKFLASSRSYVMTTGEAKNQVAAGDKPAKTVGKPPKEKKVKVVKEKKAKSAKTASHPPYFQMIKEALLALNEKGGSSPHAIAKYMEEKHKRVLPENFRKMLALQLKNSASKGKLTKVKASYKLSEGSKKPKETKAKKPKETKAKKPAAPAARATATVTVTATTGGAKKAKTAPKKAVGTPAVKKSKKMTPAKAKQPKSIKSPAAKRARKATA